MHERLFRGDLKCINAKYIKRNDTAILKNEFIIKIKKTYTTQQKLDFLYLLNKFSGQNLCATVHNGWLQ
jgi:hypothetical protein